MGQDRQASKANLLAMAFTQKKSKTPKPILRQVFIRIFFD
jgi:hypothetical protein